MEPAIRQYDFPSPSVSVSWPGRIGVFFAVACSMFILRWAWNRFFHWTDESLVRSLITSVMFAALFVFRPFRHWFPQGSGRVIIGDDFIEGRTRANWFTFKKRISRDHIKSISENKRGLCVMDRGEFAARMLGFVFVPATMLEYQEIRSELAQWASIQVKS